MFIKIRKLLMPSLLFILGIQTQTAFSQCSPLLLDLGRNGFHMGPAGLGVEFDILASGEPLTIQWVAPDGDDAFLARDNNGNGLIDDGSELFGLGTTIELTGEKAVNGFAALEQFDTAKLGGNEDGTPICSSL